MSERKEPWTIRHVLEWTRSYFSERGIESARLDAEVLLGHALNKRRVQLYIEYDAPLDADELSRFRELVRQRATRKPLHYIVNEREFWSLPFRVDARVLVPRPETEVLIEEALQWARTYSHPTPLRIADVGTGSGCLAITLAHEFDGCTICASDVSVDALAVAKDNALRNGVASQIEFCHAPLLTGCEGCFDLIVSNPPYIPRDHLASLMPEVRDHEPRIALDGGTDGLDVVRGVIEAAATRLRGNGAAIVEFDGDDQVPLLRAALLQHPALELIKIRRDYSDRARAFVAIRRS